PVDTGSKLRKVIKTTLDLFALGHPNPKVRRDAVVKLGQDQNPDYLPHFNARLSQEKVTKVQKALREAIAVTEMTSADRPIRLEAIARLEALRSINSLSLLK